MPLRIETSSLALARELWRYGEPGLAKKARALRPAKVLQLGERGDEIQLTGASDRLWPDGPRGDKALLLAATELLRGRHDQRSRSPSAREEAPCRAPGDGAGTLGCGQRDRDGGNERDPPAPEGPDLTARGRGDSPAGIR